MLAAAGNKSVTESYSYSRCTKQGPHAIDQVSKAQSGFTIADNRSISLGVLDRRLNVPIYSLTLKFND